ncbi:unnamed protein product, partial [Choristocarpus tenellus]
MEFYFCSRTWCMHTVEALSLSNPNPKHPQQKKKIPLQYLSEGKLLQTQTMCTKSHTQSKGIPRGRCICTTSISPQEQASTLVMSSFMLRSVFQFVADGLHPMAAGCHWCADP